VILQKNYPAVAFFTKVLNIADSVSCSGYKFTAANFIFNVAGVKTKQKKNKKIN